MKRFALIPLASITAVVSLIAAPGLTGSATAATNATQVRSARVASAQIPDQLVGYLWAQRQFQSGQNYSARSRYSSASGAYQYTDYAWNAPARKAIWSQFCNCPRAYMAPSYLQDWIAAIDATKAFRTYGNWAQVAMSTYYPAWAGNPAKWDTPPYAGALTLRQYAWKIIMLMTQAPAN